MNSTKKTASKMNKTPKTILIPWSWSEFWKLQKSRKFVKLPSQDDTQP